MISPVTRRKFIGGAATSGAGLCLGLAAAPAASAADSTKKAATTATTAKPVADWPLWDEREERALLDVLRSGKWGRGNGTRVKEFETVFAERMRAKFCVATSSGTTALMSSLGALNLGPGDEVILPPYTFVASFNVITANYALPVFADIDAASFQIDPTKVAAAITPATKVLLPVHIGGSTPEVGALVDLAKAKKITLLEDACQAWGAEWRGTPVGNHGIGGCFSFQASKNLTAGEGGAVITNDEAFANQVFNYHTPGTPKPGASWGRAANFRLTEFQAALLLAQYTRFNAQQDVRHANATHLSAMLEKIPGIAPAKLASGNNRSAWHLYMMRYDKTQFSNLPRAKFLQALSKAGISASAGYSSLNTSAHVKALADNPHYQRIYGKETMARWVERNRCPVNDQVIEEAVWFGQTKLLGSRSDMERTAEAIAAIRKQSGDLARA
ncbi:DegT/DnrJ/EryC1/StrS family aminotransferase [Horticoccus sp. 23ND18S-11]|uniref:DegT/DnrJ/EryC1/StrS family aminotransferase n=1 Tax=Horticoccus sp. 23ND18S-11 TaxID=3391832 RepID=UPI0039C8F75C